MESRFLYDEMHAKLNRDKNYTRRMTKRRSSTVEPVLGTLINHHNMKRVNSRGLQQACFDFAQHRLLMTAFSYNLNGGKTRKYLKFITKKVKSQAEALTQMREMFGLSINRYFQTYISWI